MNTKALFVFLAGALLVATSCDHRLPLSPQELQNSLTAGSATTARGTWTGGASHVEGTTGPGALYAMDVPENWNGDLVVYAHGYVEEPGGEVALPDIAYLRDPLLGRGFAVAYSSFSSNGYALKEGARQTHQLRGLFASRFAKPRRTIVVGQSLGGIIALKLAETYPNDYAGALLGCGVVGGTRDEIAYIANVRVLFDHFYGGVLPGSLLEVPPGTDFQALVPGIVQAIQQSPNGAFFMGQILSIQYASSNELVEAIVRALGFQFLGASDFLDRTHGHVFFDNSQVVYTGAGVPQPVLDDLNAKVARYRASSDAASYMSQYYQPSGNLEIPVLTLHTTRDPIVPLFNEDRYREIVAQAGRSELLRQRTVAMFGHCTYTVEELVAAFDELSAWVEARATPTP
jgi:pimeloyl-ACP methyl ester carboxylesterase